MLAASNVSGVVIVGAGPAGLAPLFAAASNGKLHQVLQLGVTILERGPTPGGGALTEYAIRSDSSARSFLDIVLSTNEPKLQDLRGHRITQELLSLGDGAAPLTLVASFLQLAGKVLCELVAASERGRVHLGAQAISVTRTADRRWKTHYREGDSGLEHEVTSTSVILALGAHQPEDRIYREIIAGEPLLPRFGSKLIQSGTVLAHGGMSHVTAKLRGIENPKVAIVGGSTSAGAVATRLLEPASPIQFGHGHLSLLHRKPLPICYNSVSEALADNYDEFAETDVCRLTGRVFRFSGFRLDSRELIMSARGFGNRPPEPRVRLLQLSPKTEKEAGSILDNADLIVAALGYRPKTLPIFDEDGQPVSVFIPTPARWSVVDQRGRLMRSNGMALQNLFAIGLAIGPAPDKTLGGEAGFRGQVNSLWMWQHVLGMRIIDGLLKEKAPVLFQTSAPKARVIAMPLLSVDRPQIPSAPCFTGGAR